VSFSETTGPATEVTVGFDGIHGDEITGIHGIGVKTPKEAVVAAATVGFAGFEHTPNGAMLTSGMQSVTNAAGNPQTRTGAFGITLSIDGVAPKLHLQSAP
jgi:hypothetical protein